MRRLARRLPVASADEALEELADLLRASIPDLELRLDLPSKPGGPAWLDAERNGRMVSIEWRPRRGFGISLLDLSRPPQEGLFEGPDKILADPGAVRDHVLVLLGGEAEHQAWLDPVTGALKR
ncbi:MAG TPA: hypothetical protein VEW48_07845 [Thermoanaerobaculia bacterium]|nr:hypothetical protein [Thermoanaerobaculia bacterium]